jgi:hypothetical protein
MAFPARRRNSLALTLLVAACAGGPQPLDWQMNAAQALQSFQRQYFAGSTASAEADFKSARAELSRTGRADLLARAELLRCAVRTAALEFDDCPGFEALRYGAAAEELGYAEYLAGRGRHAAGDDPLSRLVAFAVGLKSGSLTPEGMAGAVEIASAQGWRRPLLAWLAVQEKRAADAGDSETAGRIRRRIDLISG